MPTVSPSSALPSWSFTLITMAQHQQDPALLVASHVAVEQIWTRDPFDRIIVGQAALHQTMLVTKDRAMRKHYPHAFWS
jgi:predicted nuclease of predicted toxin-antitoxin system